MMDLNCPNRASENTQRLSLAVEGGTYSNSGVMVGVGATGSGAGLLAASTIGSSMSRLAKKHEAPEKVPIIRGGISVIAIAWLISLLTGSWALTLGCLIAAVAAVWGWKYNLKDYPDEMIDWNAKYLCLRYSEVFTPADGGADFAQR